MDTTMTLREYLGKKKDFVIPEYQRGYIWGKKRTGGEKDSVSYILEKTIVPGFLKKTEVFLQGITVHESDEKIVIIDGQQRTTFLYLLLKWLGYKERFSLNYDIRHESDSFLKKEGLLFDCEDNQDEEYQDIYFFKKTLRLISSILKPYAKDDMLGYLLDKIRFLYINIPKPEQATKVFSMMNGNRAVMQAEEVIKAELLRVASLPNDHQVISEAREQMAQEWDCNLLRSRYAREWDKWLQWWNRDDVKYFYRCNNVMGCLISTYLRTASSNFTTLTFEDFKEAFLSPAKSVNAKKAFDGLRRLQKRFEDAFNTPSVYNRIGAVLRIGNADEFIKWYFLGTKKTMEELDRYYRRAFLHLTHKEIISNDKEQFETKYAIIRKALDDDFIFLSDNKEIAYRLFLRLNIDEDTKQNRKFDFGIWNNRSLEHIYPKSKVFHYDDEQKLWLDGNDYPLSSQIKPDSNEYLDRADCKCVNGNATEHCIGNLVLLYGGNNSEFRDKPFEEKKRIYFSVRNIFASRHLLHTVFKFAQSHWTGEDIATNKYNTLKEFEDYYKEFEAYYGK